MNLYNCALPCTNSSKYDNFATQKWKFTNLICCMNVCCILFKNVIFFSKIQAREFLNQKQRGIIQCLPSEGVLFSLGIAHCLWMQCCNLLWNNHTNLLEIITLSLARLIRAPSLNYFYQVICFWLFYYNLLTKIDSFFSTFCFENMFLSLSTTATQSNVLK